MVELLGIATEMQARRALYARFQYRAPTLDPPKRPILRAIERPQPAPKPPKQYPPTRPFLKVVEAVCNAWGVTRYELLGPGKKTRECLPRYAMERICRERLGWSLPHIAAQLGYHHTSVMHGIDRAKELNRHHRDWRNRYKAALIELRGGVV